MNKSAATLLLGGEYICQYRYQNEWDALQASDEQEEVDAWLGKMGKRLARLGDDGAFFMAPLLMNSEDIKHIKGEFLLFRDVYGPSILMLDMIRQTDTLNLTLSPGEYIHLYVLEQAVANSSTLEMQLKTRLAVIDNASQRATVRENLRRLVEHLAKDGYLAVANKDTGAYRVTGKVDQLYAVMQYIAANVALAEMESPDMEDADADLVDAAQEDGSPM